MTLPLFIGAVGAQADLARLLHDEPSPFLTSCYDRRFFSPMSYRMPSGWTCRRCDVRRALAGFHRLRDAEADFVRSELARSTGSKAMEDRHLPLWLRMDLAVIRGEAT